MVPDAIILRLASSLCSNDEAPNIPLGQRIAAASDTDATAALIDAWQNVECFRANCFERLPDLTIVQSKRIMKVMRSLPGVDGN